ncbi:response regulator transcription factor [Colwellia sp. 1_MG-2023]|uniref:response regulator transcription factor n=1 Tax=Colwellia sp. 1_MG-2023 TaxID=3062649 RepID=UPI0026E40A9A|nr:response regulator transcription factor [Colwellia sp. 1_MG-2023]MDO6447018.1 response regulator transcription factor [Colwellia sp. 1_MG-2023]
MKTIYLVDGDVKLCHQIKRFLEPYRYQVIMCHDGSLAVDEILKRQPDIVILDLILPKVDGFDVGRKLSGKFQGKLLVLTTSCDDMDHVAGIEMGADDFYTKPIHPRVLLARIRMLLRRANNVSNKFNLTDFNLMKFGDLELNFSSRNVKLAGMDVPLTTSEYDLLNYFAQNVNKVISRDNLLNTIRGIDYDGLDRSIDIKIGTLRKKLGDNGKSPKGIITIRNKGYMFVGDAWENALQ